MEVSLKIGSNIINAYKKDWECFEKKMSEILDIKKAS